MLLIFWINICESLSKSETIFSGTNLTGSLAVLRGCGNSVQAEENGVILNTCSDQITGYVFACICNFADGLVVLGYTG